jgi:ribosomal-protein-alanine N-acetyltransferase
MAAEDLETCAALMAGSDPWLRLGVDLPSCRRILAQPERESWAAWQHHKLVGFAVLNFKGPFVGYVQLLGVAPQVRSQGIGAALLAHAERCIFARTANVFICVSSFNGAAQRFYARQGYAGVRAFRRTIWWRATTNCCCARHAARCWGAERRLP